MKWPDSLATVLEDSAPALGERLAADVGECLNLAIEERGMATLMVSGGSTPHPFFAALSSHPVDWSRVTIGLVDERYVDAGHPDSNERLVRERLLTGAVTAATFVGMYHPGGLQSAVTASQQALAKLLAAQNGLFDVVVLGMGGDAHTASLFPAHDGNREQLARALDVENSGNNLVCSMLPAAAPHQRISLMLKPITDSRHVFLHITGESKQQVLLNALKVEDAMNAPIAAVFTASGATAPVIYWAP